jgi:hypothetical protein
MIVTPQFTLRGLMVFMVAIACCLSVSRAIGLVLGTFLVALVMCYVLASFQSVRARVICAMCASFFALLPWLGLGHGSFVLMGTSPQSLPTVSIPSVIRPPLAALYALAQGPLNCVPADGNEFSQVIFFAGEGVATVRPFIVFIFWLGFALTFSLSIGYSLLANWLRRKAQRGDRNGPIQP